MVEKACPKCYKITYDDQCPLCGSKTSRNWTGLLVVLDPDESDIAKELNINSPGRYALKVRE
jgi:DNA-directed RNA polymerase subunit E"